MKFTNLGMAVAAVQNAMFPDVDYQLASHGGVSLEGAQIKAFDKAAAKYGFRDASHLRAEVERRTSTYWAYKNLPYAH